MDLFTELLVKVISGILYVVYWLVIIMVWIAWWLTVFLVLSLGAGVAWLARGGRGREVDTGRFGHYLEDGSGWWDDASGTVYAVSATRERCQVEARDAGMYGQRTALYRLIRRGAVLRYRFAAVTDPSPDGRHGIAAWCEFPFEARKDFRLDDLEPANSASGVSADARDALDANLGQAMRAHDHLERLLAQRGWEPDDPPQGLPGTRWYATSYSRRAISFATPVPAAATAQPTDSQPTDSQPADSQR
jgi:hypothetical protein